jgi:thiol-disulfide isomerase/thioredoxin
MMTNLLRSGALLLAAAVLWLPSAAAGAEESAEGPELVLVKFHADWCGSCKEMGSVFEDLGDKLDREPVLLVELDQTTSAGRDQAGYLMQLMQAEEIWEEHGGKTGFILVVDPADISVKHKLTKDMNFKDMLKAVDEARG